MATKSIIKNVTLRDRALGRSFVSALENAKGKKCIPTVSTRKHEDIKGDNIKKLFGVHQ